MLSELSKHGICVSSGSACSSHSKNLSATLTAFGLTPEQIDSTIRISLCAQNTEAEIDSLISVLGEAIDRLVRIHHAK